MARLSRLEKYRNQRSFVQKRPISKSVTAMAGNDPAVRIWKVSKTAAWKLETSHQLLLDPEVLI